MSDGMLNWTKDDARDPKINFVAVDIDQLPYSVAIDLIKNEIAEENVIAFLKRSNETLYLIDRSNVDEVITRAHKKEGKDADDYSINAVKEINEYTGWGLVNSKKYYERRVKKVVLTLRQKVENWLSEMGEYEAGKMLRRETGWDEAKCEDFLENITKGKKRI